MNMINPANYYNPFAKYNYVSKTRGVYIPKDAQPLLQASVNVEKSSSIFSENYDAEKDIELALNDEKFKNNFSGKFFGFLNNFLN